MEEITRRLTENRQIQLSKEILESAGYKVEKRLDESTKKVALESIARELRDKFSKISGYSHHKLSILPNMEDSCVEVIFKGTGDAFRVYPEKSKISNENSNKTVKVSDIHGAYIEENKVYNSEGELLGDALVRMKAIHNKSDYSVELEKADYRFNSKISNLKDLEKYVAREAINNMK